MVERVIISSSFKKRKRVSFSVLRPFLALTFPFVVVSGWGAGWGWGRSENSAVLLPVARARSFGLRYFLFCERKVFFGVC